MIKKIFNKIRWFLCEHLDERGEIGGAFGRTKSQEVVQREALPGIFGDLTGDRASTISEEALNVARRLGTGRLPGVQEVGSFQLPQGQVGAVGAQGQVGQTGSAFQDPLQQAILNPQFGPTTASEQALLNSLQSQTQGAAAVRGLGPAGQASIAQSIAPALIGLRQQQIGNLQGAFGQDVNRLLGQRGQDITQRGQDIQAELTGRGQDITQRAGDIQALLAGRGQDITQRAQDIGRLKVERQQDIKKEQALTSLLIQLAELARPGSQVTGTTGRQSSFNFGGEAKVGDILGFLTGGGLPTTG